MTIDGDADATGLYSLHADQSQRRYARSPDVRFVAPKTYESEWIWDDTSAALALEWRIETMALLHRRVVVAGGPWLGSLDPGAVVIIDDTSRGLHEVPAIVQSIRWAGVDAVECAMLIYEHPARDVRYQD